MDNYEKSESEDNDEIITENQQVAQQSSSQESSSSSKFGKTRENPKRRHSSQPNTAYKNKNQKPRPMRSMGNMEAVAYDPTNRKFIMRQTGDNEHGYESGDVQVSTIFTEHNNHINEYGNQAFSTPFNDTRSTSGKMSVRKHKNSLGASLGSFDLLDLHSTSPEERERKFRSTLTLILSCMYGIFLVTLGILIFVADIFIETKLSEFYCLYLVFAGLIYLIYLYIDIRFYTKKAHKYHEDKRLYEIYLESRQINNPALPEYNKQLTMKPVLPPKPLEHPYCFSQGRHAGSFYLKLGAAAFFLGHLVHSVLFLSLHIIYLTSDKDEDCGSVPVLVLDIVYPLYSCMQLFFIFKYSNVIILKCKALARFVLMHCIAASLCFWVWTIIREIMESLTVYAKKQNKHPDTTTVAPDSSEEIDTFDFMSKDANYISPFRANQNRMFNLSNLADDVCLSVHGFENIIETVYPYLYPFTIEFSILIAGIFYIIWSNIGNCKKNEEMIDLPEKENWDDSKSSHATENCKLPIPVEENGEESNAVIHIDCHSSNRGWFFGLILMVATVVIIIICFIAVQISNNDKENNAVHYGIIIKDVSELCLHLIMLISVVVAYYQTRQLDVNHHPISLLDDLLLFICIPAFYMEATFTLIPSAKYQNFVMFFNAVLMILQITVQTPFIIDGLRRCSNSKQLRKSKPGRELIAFLVVCNVATWIFETFSVKNAETSDERYDFYGKILWTILGHISTPLCMFYRFHSSVCLVDIWKGAYQPGNSH